MKIVIKVLLYVLLSVFILLILIIGVSLLKMIVSANQQAKESLALAGSEVKMIVAEGMEFRDLNKNGTLDIYEDRRQPLESRINDLMAKMTLEEKAGIMFVPPIVMNKDGSLSERFSFSDLFSFLTEGTSVMIFKKNISHFNIFIGTGKREMAIWYNNLQKHAEKTRLGIPVTIASDPRNQYSSNPLASAFSGDFSVWPEPAGLAAIGDSALVYRFANMARQEYLAVGLRVALHPMADLATEPRWPRIGGTFGEDAQLAAKLTYAYIKGFQGDTLGPHSVACMTKHFSGGGPQKEGIDPHFPIAKGQIYPGNNFNYHLIPFEAAFRAGTAEIMPYYGVPMDVTDDNVGFSFNREMITGVLRTQYKFDGIVCTDWGILTDFRVFGLMVLPARARGMENATPEERMLKAILAGVDQFGGEMLPEMIVKLVRDGKINEARLDSSVRRILRVKFIQGLFDDPFVDPDFAEQIVGNDDFREAGEDAQRKSIVLLKNDTAQGYGRMLPLKKGLKIYAKGIDPEKLILYGTVVNKPEHADVAIVRVKAPGEVLEGTGILGKMFNMGDLNFKGKENRKILKIIRKVPTVLDIYLDRPAVIPLIAAGSKGVIANFGASDEALLDIIFGEVSPTGRLPFEMPSSMNAVRAQKEDVPYDSPSPLFKFGHGLTY
jgi:beta-glucosidase